MMANLESDLQKEVEIMDVSSRVRAEIDTSAPFRSVKEAVALFGERVLAGEVYANKLKKIGVATSGGLNGPSKLCAVTAELEETKECLKKTQEENLLLANCLTSLKRELEQEKREIQKIKAKEIREPHKQPPIDCFEIEDIKVIEDSTNIQVNKLDFQRKRYVKFADSPSLARVMNNETTDALLERHPSLKRKKKKPLIPFIGGIFSKKKVPQEVASTKTPRS